MAKIQISEEKNQAGRIFLYVNGNPTYTSWMGDENRPQIEVIDNRLFVDGKLAILPKFASGVMDNRHRNWRRRNG